MTKRYCAVNEKGYVYPIFFDNEKDGKEISAEEVVDILNTLEEENKKLKSDKEKISYKDLNDVIEKVTEDYMMMLKSNRMTFSEFAILENLVLRIKEGLRYKAEKEGSEHGKQKRR